MRPPQWGWSQDSSAWRVAYAATHDSQAFLSPEWVESYRSCFEDCQVVGFHDADRRHALAAAHYEKRFGARILGIAAGHDMADYTDILLGADSMSAQAMSDLLLSIPDLDVVECPHTPPWAQVWRLAAAWPGPVLQIPSSSSPCFDGASLEQYLDKLPGRRRREFTRQSRRIAEEDVSWDVVSNESASVECAVDRLLEWHVQHWAGRGLNQLHESPQFRRFLFHLAMTGRSRIIRFSKSGEVFGYAYFVTDSRRARNYLVAYAPHRIVKFSQNVLEIVAAFDALHPFAEGVDFLRGAHAEKVRFSSSVVCNHRLILMKPGSVRGYLYGLAALSRSAISASEASSLWRRAWPRLALERSGQTEGILSTSDYSTSSSVAGPVATGEALSGGDEESP